jgi:hypothetical protein
VLPTAPTDGPSPGTIASSISATVADWPKYDGLALLALLLLRSGSRGHRGVANMLQRRTSQSSCETEAWHESVARARSSRVGMEVSLDCLRNVRARAMTVRHLADLRIGGTPRLSGLADGDGVMALRRHVFLGY